MPRLYCRSGKCVNELEKTYKEGKLFDRNFVTFNTVNTACEILKNCLSGHFDKEFGEETSKLIKKKHKKIIKQLASIGTKKKRKQIFCKSSVEFQNLVTKKVLPSFLQNLAK